MVPLPPVASVSRSAGSRSTRGPSARTAISIPPDPALGADVETTSPHERIAGEEREVEKQADRALGKLLVLDDPAKLDLAVAEQPLERRFGLARVDLVGKAAARAESEPEELELVRGRPGAVRQQFEALLLHVRVGFVSEQLDAVVESPDGRHEVMAQA